MASWVPSESISAPYPAAPRTARFTAGFFARALDTPCLAACATRLFPRAFFTTPPPRYPIPPKSQFVTISSAAVRAAFICAPFTGRPSMMSCRYVCPAVWAAISVPATVNPFPRKPASFPPIPAAFPVAPAPRLAPAVAYAAIADGAMFPSAFDALYAQFSGPDASFSSMLW